MHRALAHTALRLENRGGLAMGYMQKGGNSVVGGMVAVIMISHKQTASTGMTLPPHLPAWHCPPLTNMTLFPFHQYASP